MGKRGERCGQTASCRIARKDCDALAIEHGPIDGGGIMKGGRERMLWREPIIWQDEAQFPATGKSAYESKPDRSEERRVGRVCVSTCRYRWWTNHIKKQNDTKQENTEINSNNQYKN